MTKKSTKEKDAIDQILDQLDLHGMTQEELFGAEVLLFKTRYRYYLADSFTIFRLAACAFATLCMVWQVKRYVPLESPSANQDNMENKQETSEEQPSN